jgi:hypothetical protein
MGAYPGRQLRDSCIPLRLVAINHLDHEFAKHPRSVWKGQGVGEIAVREDLPRLFARLVFPLTAKDAKTSI